MSFPRKERHEILRTSGCSLAQVFSQLCGQQPQKLTDQFTNLFKVRADEVMAQKTMLYSFVPIVLSTLRQRRKQIGIVTNKFRYRIEEILVREKLINVIDVIIGGEDVSTLKPNPEGLILASKKLGRTTSQVLYIGDSIIDAQTAESGKFDFLAVLTGVTRREEFDAYPNIQIIENISDIIPSIE